MADGSIESDMDAEGECPECEQCGKLVGDDSAECEYCFASLCEECYERARCCQMAANVAERGYS